MSDEPFYEERAIHLRVPGGRVEGGREVVDLAQKDWPSLEDRMELAHADDFASSYAPHWIKLAMYGFAVLVWLISAAGLIVIAYLAVGSL